MGEYLSFHIFFTILIHTDTPGRLTARTRKSAVKARKNMQPSSSTATLEVVDKSLRTIKRHRKQRYAKLREMTRDEEDVGGLSGFRGGRGRWAGNGQGTLCPVCLKMVPGDPDVVEAHVDACLAHEARMQNERDQLERDLQRQGEAWEDIDVDDGVQLRATDGASLRGRSFHPRIGCIAHFVYRTGLCRTKRAAARC